MRLSFAANAPDLAGWHEVPAIAQAALLLKHLPDEHQHIGCIDLQWLSE
jgi:hypothetical protein